mmetsp:Transcript_22768/g.59998  ORF Transcript_22768/g.59998 Transcript_22768/m.59998 type:complete len:313 (+) Transcript_22768:742-1680(+)
MHDPVVCACIAWSARLAGVSERLAENWVAFEVDCGQAQGFGSDGTHAGIPFRSKPQHADNTWVRIQVLVQLVDDMVQDSLRLRVGRIHITRLFALDLEEQPVCSEDPVEIVSISEDSPCLKATNPPFFCLGEKERHRSGATLDLELGPLSLGGRGRFHEIFFSHAAALRHWHEATSLFRVDVSDGDTTTVEVSQHEAAVPTCHPTFSDPLLQDLVALGGAAVLGILRGTVRLEMCQVGQAVVELTLRWPCTRDTSGRPPPHRDAHLEQVHLGHLVRCHQARGGSTPSESATTDGDAQTIGHFARKGRQRKFV